jgi:hypothetical protein
MEIENNTLSHRYSSQSKQNGKTFDPKESSVVTELLGYDLYERQYWNPDIAILQF